MRGWWARRFAPLPTLLLHHTAFASARLFLTFARHPPQHEMAERRGDGFFGIVLPGLGLERDHAAALLDDRGAGVAVERPAGAQVVDGEPDRLRRRRDAEFARDADDRRGFEQGAG